MYHPKHHEFGFVLCIPITLRTTPNLDAKSSIVHRKQPASVDTSEENMLRAKVPRIIVNQNAQAHEKKTIVVRTSLGSKQ